LVRPKRVFTDDETAEMRTKLTDKQQRFCQEYIIDLNATQAAVRAGYSIKTAHAIGHENLIKPYVKGEIVRLQADKAEKLSLSAEQVLNNLWTVYNRAIETDRLADANKASELLGRHLGMFKDRLEVEAYPGQRPPDTEQAIERSRQRIEQRTNDT